MQIRGGLPTELLASNNRVLGEKGALGYVRKSSYSELVLQCSFVEKNQLGRLVVLVESAEQDPVNFQVNCLSNCKLETAITASV